MHGETMPPTGSKDKVATHAKEPTKVVLGKACIPLWALGKHDAF